MPKKVKKIKRKAKEPKMKYGDDSDYQKRKSEGTINKRKFKRLKPIKIQRKINKDDPTKCPKCKKRGELLKRTPMGSNVHYSYKCLKHGFYAHTVRGKKE